VVVTSLLLPRNSGPSEEIDAITVHHKQHSGSFTVGSHGFHETSYGIWDAGDRLLKHCGQHEGHNSLSRLERNGFCHQVLNG
jgi:hypothetical protein